MGKPILLAARDRAFCNDTELKMAQKPKRKWLMILGVIGGVLLVLAVCGFVGWQMLMNYFVQQYFYETYSPIQLAADGMGDAPAIFHLQDVPWFSTDRPYCAATSLQMIAAQRGTNVSLGEINFLMGFSYGASENASLAPMGQAGFFPFTDPESGHVAAAPYLGLARRYYITSDDKLYLEAMRSFLSRGYPVRVPLDAAVLYALQEPMPHSDLVVGYDEKGFYYYETVCAESIPCQPGQLPAGEQGLYVSDEQLLKAVASQAKLFSYSWRYAFTIFEPGPTQADLGPIWARNGQFLVGGAQYGPRQGADAINASAAQVEKSGAKTNVADIRSGVEIAVYSRSDMAAFLRERFAGNQDIERAADLFDQAADNYQTILDATQASIADQAEAGQIAAWLREAATSEREAGQIFIQQGQ